jgi:hypothetical protein
VGKKRPEPLRKFPVESGIVRDDDVGVAHEALDRVRVDRLTKDTAFLAQWAVRGLALKPNDVVPGWDEHFVALVRENSRASNALEKSRTVEGQLERKRLEYALASQSLVLPPPDTAIRNFGAEVPLAPVQLAPAQSTKYVRLKMSEVLTRFVATQRSQGIDGRVESEVAPIVSFVISLLDDPVMLDINGDHLLTIKREVAEIPLPKGFGQDERSLYFRWSTAKQNGWVRQRDEKAVQLKRVSQTTLDGKYAPGLTAFWKFAIEHSFAYGPVPSFEFGTKLNRPAAERDAYNEEEVLTFFGAAPFTGCKSIAHCWNEGPQYIQGYFFWANLIELLGGMRPSEIAQLRCRDILEFRGEPHFRYAPFAPEETEKQRFDPQPGGTRGKTSSAYRWIAIHRLLLKLGIVEHRDAIVDAYCKAKIKEGGGADKLSVEQRAAIEDAADEQWLFPDWKIYVRPKTEQIMWSHADQGLHLRLEEAEDPPSRPFELFGASRLQGYDRRRPGPERTVPQGDLWPLDQDQCFGRLWSQGDHRTAGQDRPTADEQDDLASRQAVAAGQTKGRVR